MKLIAQAIAASLLLFATAGCVEDSPAGAPNGTTNLDAGSGDAQNDPDSDAEISCECAPRDNANVECVEGECEYTCIEGAVECGDSCRVPSTEDTACGVCAPEDCTTSTFQADGACDTDTGDEPVCTFTCEEGWVDSNGDLSDGCECPADAASFEFDGGVYPVNCADFADSALYVRPGANGTGLSPDSPIGSLSDAIASREERIVVLISTAMDNQDALAETLTLDGTDFPSGLQIAGGRGADWQPSSDADVRSLVTSSSDAPVLTASGFVADAPLRLSNIELEHLGTSQENAAAITVRLEQISDGGLLMERVRIIGGPGGPGADGGDGANGMSAQDGEAGQGSQTQTDLNTPVTASGGQGGLSDCNSFGGNGGLASTRDELCTPRPTGGPGSPGLQSGSASPAKAPGGDGGGAKCVAQAAERGDDADSVNTMSLMRPTPPAADHPRVGAFDSGSWIALRASSGDEGADGIGGGAGGAGGPAVLQSGGGGGGGGGGGCGGSGGEGGVNGGDSIAVLLIDSQVDFTEIDIELGRGGDGGAGGNGGCGGAGGDGGDGGMRGSVAAGGGNGADGTNGVAGAGGAGGHGGASVGIAHVGSAPAGEANFQMPSQKGGGGAGGLGGQGTDRDASTPDMPAICDGAVTPSTRAADGQVGETRLVLDALVINP